MKYEDDKDVSKYVIQFKQVYKRVDSHKSIPSRTIIRKFINSLSSKFVKFLTIIGPASLNETIKAMLDVKASQKVKARKKDQVYIVEIIEELHQEIHNL